MGATILRVKGMDCEGCEQRISTVLRRLEGVSAVAADHRSGSVSIDYDEGAVEPGVITERLEQAGYEVVGKEEPR